MRPKKLAGVVLAACAATLLIATPARAVVAVAVPGSFATTYGTPVVVTRVGGPVTFINGDIPIHDFVAMEDFLPKKKSKEPWCKKFQKGKCPLFWSEAVGTGGVAQVQGLANVKAGEQYTFFCTIHPRMQGTLVVGP